MLGTRIRQGLCCHCICLFMLFGQLGTHGAGLGMSCISWCQFVALHTILHLEASATAHMNLGNVYLLICGLIPLLCKMIGPATCEHKPVPEAQ